MILQLSTQIGNHPFMPTKNTNRGLKTRTHFGHLIIARDRLEIVESHIGASMVLSNDDRVRLELGQCITTVRDVLKRIQKTIDGSMKEVTQ